MTVGKSKLERLSVASFSGKSLIQTCLFLASLSDIIVNVVKRLLYRQQ